MSRDFPPLLAMVMVAGIAALAWGTEGFRVVTSEGAHRLAVEDAPPAVPDAALVDQTGARFTLNDYRGRIVLIEFIYTSCPTICGVLGDDFGQVLEAIRRDPPAPDIALLSISFDPTRDGPEALRRYGERFGATAPAWRIGVPTTATALAALLRTFGVVAIPDGLGGFAHNAAIYVVDRRGRLVRVLDPAAPPALVTQALEVAAS